MVLDGSVLYIGVLDVVISVTVCERQSNSRMMIPGAKLHMIW